MNESILKDLLCKKIGKAVRIVHLDKKEGRLPLLNNETMSWRDYLLCNETYLKYDVSHYPAASGYDPDKGKFRKWVSPEGDDCFQVIASWLYPEESEEDDEDNDLDWFCLVARKTGTDRYYEVVNDETE